MLNNDIIILLIVFLLLLIIIGDKCVFSYDDINFNKYYKVLNNNYNNNVITWILTPSNVSTIHRFFDSSPISPSGRYIALTSYHKESKELDNYSLKYSNIVVIDLYNGTSTIIDRTLAWDTQVGAHTQWGSSDDQLIYNIIHNKKVIGVIYNIFNKQKIYLNCSIYHISSDGLLGVSPDLTKIRFTQSGYGVYMPNAIENRDSSSEDGLYLSNLTSGDCKLLISLRNISNAIGLNVNIPTYGFHTKWSSDNKKIIFVMRTLDLNQNNQNKVRRQHLIVIDMKSLDNIKYVITWCSKPFLYNNQLIQPIDGNHPNWIPNSYNISMNIKSNQTNCKWDLININSITLDKKVVYHCSSGHPNHYNNRYVLMDMYNKEFKSNALTTQAPLKLIDLYNQKEFSILNVNLINKEVVRFRKSGDVWRCDMHPVWSKDYRYIVINGRPDGLYRQVLLTRIHSNLSSYFD